MLITDFRKLIESVEVFIENAEIVAWERLKKFEDDNENGIRISKTKRSIHTNLTKRWNCWSTLHRAIHQFTEDMKNIDNREKDNTN